MEFFDPIPGYAKRGQTRFRHNRVDYRDDFLNVVLIPSLRIPLLDLFLEKKGVGDLICGMTLWDRLQTEIPS